MCLKAFNKVGHCSNLYQGRYSFSTVLKLLIVSLYIVTQQEYWLCCCLPEAESACHVHPPVLSLCFGGELSIWSKIHSACWCLLPRSRSPVAVQYPVCIHKNERENTHREKILLRRVIDSVINRWLAISFLPLILFITQSSSPPQSKSEFLTHHRFCPQTKTCREWSKPRVRGSEQSCGSLYIPTVPMGGQTERQVEMHVLRRTQEDSQNHRSLY